MQHMYIRNTDKHPFGVIAFEMDPDGTIFVGSSLCNPNDQFSKKIGRAVAYGRLKSKYKKMVRDDEDVFTMLKDLHPSVDCVPTDSDAPYDRLRDVSDVTQDLFKQIVERLRKNGSPSGV